MAGSIACVSAAARRLEGKVALITGGARGIGERTARLFSDQGAKIVIADVQEELGRSVCKDLKTPSIFVSCDVTKEVQVERAVNAAISEFKKLDIIINNAGTIGKNPHNILENELSDFQHVVGVNLIGAFLGTKHAARVMIPNRRGSIIMMGSVASVVGGSSSNAYTSSKHGLVGLMKNAAVELGQYGIRVNCVSPYAVPTEMGVKALKTKVKFEDLYENLKSGKPLEEEDIAETALYLAGDESKYVSGHNLIVDGGVTVVNRGLAFFGSSS